MTTMDKYAKPLASDQWQVGATGTTFFTWDYDDGRDRLLNLYQKGKDKQWDAQKRIDWSIEVDPKSPLGIGEEYSPIYGSDIWNKLSQKERDELGQHLGSWTFSQFLHGEQGAMMVAAKIVESVPDIDSKFYAATQTMDEARHVELYAKFLQDKVGLVYPINDHLAKLLEDSLSDGRWDLPYLGMQVLIEGLALAAFGLYRDMAQNPLTKQLLAYVMQDEARHVAFGRLALRDYYRELSDAERAEREDFVVEGCYLMRDRFRGTEVWENWGFDVDECLDYVEHSEMQRVFRSLLFSRIVPCVKDIGLWGDKVQKAYADMGVLDMAGVKLEDLMKADEDIADEIDRQKAAVEQQELAVRASEVDAAIAAGADA